MEKERDILAGIDVSKKTLDLAVWIKDKIKCTKFKATDDGFGELIDYLRENGKQVVAFEASGLYCSKLAGLLHKNKFKVYMLSPLPVFRFRQLKHPRLKTDKSDAKVILQYIQLHESREWKPEPRYMLNAKNMYSVIEQLGKARRQISLQMESLASAGRPATSIRKATQTVVDTINEQIVLLDRKLEETIVSFHDWDYKNLMTIPGIGKKTAIALIVYTNCFKKFQSARQVSSYFGLTPKLHESGNSINKKTRITKMGSKRVRNLLYLCAMSARKNNPSCKDLYDRQLQKGKARRSALIAVANKLVRQAFSVVKRQRNFEVFSPLTKKENTAFEQVPTGI